MAEGNGHDRSSEFAMAVENAGGFWNGAAVLKHHLESIQYTHRQNYLAAVQRASLIHQIEDLRRASDQARRDFIEAMKAGDFEKAADATARQTRAITRLTMLGVKDDAQ